MKEPGNDLLHKTSQTTRSTMINNLARIGNFTSSENYRLRARDKSGKGFGKTALS